jgi:hypothetical protein
VKTEIVTCNISYLQEVEIMSFKSVEPLSHDDIVFAEELGWSTALASAITAIAVILV